LRPRAAYAFGLLNYWAPLASRFPRLTNFGTQTPLVRDLVKAALGIAPPRRIPVFADESFRSWFERRSPINEDRPPVMLWVDSFNNYFYPPVLQAATEILEAAGYRVTIPRQNLSEGRTVYDFGMLGI